MGKIAGRCQVFIMSAALLIAACGKSEPTANRAPEAAAVVELPLKRGFYVASDTPCAAASNATLLLLRQDGFNSARDTCDFKTIERAGPTTYRVTAQCAHFQAGPDSAETLIVDWEVPDDASFALTNDAGPARSFQHCQQTSLPDPWRDNDISDLIGQPSRQ